MAEHKPNPYESLTFSEQVAIGLRLGIQDAIEEHRRAGVPMVIWRDGKVVHISPDEAAEMLRASAPDHEPTPPDPAPSDSLP